MSNVEDTDSDTDNEFDEEAVIRYYFQRGFQYKEIILLLSKHYNHTISYGTLLRKLKAYGLSRRNLDSKYDHAAVKKRVEEIVDGPGSCGGYRSVWHTLKLEGFLVPRIVVQHLLKETDPDGVKARKAHRLKRRVYRNPGPNYAWHMDGYDKLKPWGFPIHGCIDGFSRRILWLQVTRTNNSPNVPAKCYVDTVAEFGGVPIELVTDLGTENCLAASMQCYIRQNLDAHRYVPSPRNQRIEGWWSFFCKNRTTWWRGFFQDLEDQHVIDTTSDLNNECLWYCFSDILQEEVNNVKEQWNSHYIRKSRHDTPHGRPDSLFLLPELHGGTADLLLKIPVTQLNEMSGECSYEDESNIFQEYFEYARECLGASKPKDWKSALQLLQDIMSVAENVNNE